MVMSVILMTTLFYKALILQGEIWCWSLSGFKGLKALGPHGTALMFDLELLKIDPFAPEILPKNTIWS